MHEWMHIRRGQIRLLIPCSCWQNDVRIQRSCCHPEVKSYHKVELSFHILTPHNLLWLLLFIRACQQGIRCTEQMLQEVFLSLGGAGDQIRTPHEE
ncbi:hypothetical protein D1872_281080 [compost metagenome]